MEEVVGADWRRYWRAADRPLEAMHAGFRRHVYDRHSHDAYSFGVTERGAQAFTCRGAARTSAAGMVMAFNPDEPHDGHTATADGFVYRIVYMGPGLVADVLGDAAGRPVGAPLVADPVVRDPAVADAVWRLHAALLDGADPLVRDERLTAAVLALTGRAATRPAAAAPDAGRRAVMRAVARARDALADPARPDRDLDLDALAGVAGCSRFALYRAFRQVYGMAPSAYRRQLRLRTARDLLRHDTPIAEAATAAGFADQAHLTRWFVRCYGVTPATYAHATG